MKFICIVFFILIESFYTLIETKFHHLMMYGYGPPRDDLFLSFTKVYFLQGNISFE